MKKPFADALPVLEKIESAGFEAYFVGGSVRDLLLDREIKDVDIATSALPLEIKKLFAKTVDVGIEHGTVLVLYNGESYEVTTFRTESGYEDFRKPSNVTFISSLSEDLKRRDFTMNSLAMDKDGQIIDPFGGRQDIRQRKIRTVGKAEERFGEDALRIMRAMRFVSQLQFYIEEETYSALVKSAPLLQNIAQERKTAEFEKLLAGEGRRGGLLLIAESGIGKFLPGLAGQEAVIRKLAEYDNSHLGTIEMWVLLLYCLKVTEEEIEVFFRAWKMPVRRIKEAGTIYRALLRLLEKEWDEMSLFQAGRLTISSAEKLMGVIKGCDHIDSLNSALEAYESLPLKSREELCVSGADLLSWFEKKGGPWVGDLLSKAEQAVLAGRLPNDKDKIREWLLTCNQQ